MSNATLTAPTQTLLTPRKLHYIPGKPHRSTSLLQTVELQALLIKQAKSAKTSPGMVASLVRVWKELEELRHRLKGKPLLAPAKADAVPRKRAPAGGHAATFAEPAPRPAAVIPLVVQNPATVTPDPIQPETEQDKAPGKCPCPMIKTL